MGGKNVNSTLYTCNELKFLKNHLFCYFAHNLIIKMILVT